MAHRESKLQQACVRYFRIQYRDLAPCFFSVPNGMLTSESQARIAVAEGLWKGVADTLLLVPRNGWHGLAVEFKQEAEEWKGGKRKLTRTYQRPEQKEWQAAIEAQGYRYEVVRTFEEFESLMKEYLG